MRKTRFIENCRCYHLISRLAHQAFFLDDDEKTRAVALLRRPAGCGRVEIRLNGKFQPTSGEYGIINRAWKAGDAIEIVFGGNK